MLVHSIQWIFYPNLFKRIWTDIHFTFPITLSLVPSPCPSVITSHPSELISIVLCKTNGQFRSIIRDIDWITGPIRRSPLQSNHRYAIQLNPEYCSSIRLTHSHRDEVAVDCFLLHQGFPLTASSPGGPGLFIWINIISGQGLIKPSKEIRTSFLATTSFTTCQCRVIGSWLNYSTVCGMERVDFWKG